MEEPLIQKNETPNPNIPLYNPKSIINSLYKDESNEAKHDRKMMMIRAAVGEFMCTFLFFTMVFGVLVETTRMGIKTELVKLLVGLTASFGTIAVIYSFSNISGAHCNPAISFALWSSGKLSNRKLIGYHISQLIGSISAVAVVMTMFENPYDILDILAIEPTIKNNYSYVAIFLTEFFLTFIIAYVAFVMALEDAESEKLDSMNLNTVSSTRGLTIYATTPQSKFGFAPLAIGFTVFSVTQVGGTSGGAFNPARMFGPAVLSGRWKYFYIYYVAQYLGASVAGLIVHNIGSGLYIQNKKNKDLQHVDKDNLISDDIECGNTNTPENNTKESNSEFCNEETPILLEKFQQHQNYESAANILGRTATEYILFNGTRPKNKNT